MCQVSVPLTFFRSNSTFDQNSQCSDLGDYLGGPGDFLGFRCDCLGGPDYPGGCWLHLVDYLFVSVYVCVHWAISYKGIFYSRFPNGLYWSIDPYWHRATARCVCLCKCSRPWPHGQFGNPNLLFIVHLLSTTLKSLQTSYHLSYGTLVSKLIVIFRNGHTHNNF